MSLTPKSTRREFLTGAAAVDALADVGAQGSGDFELPESSAGAYLLKLSRRAMACQFELFLNAGQYAQGTEVGLAAFDLVDRLEDQLSVYRPTSEISRLNQLAPEQPVVVEERFFALLQAAVVIHDQTQGAYDVTSGSLSRAWGFTRRAGALPDSALLAEVLECVGSRQLELNPADHSVRFLRPDVEINLGSIGKGYALDRCAEILLAAGVHDFLLHGGNSSVLARGAHAGLPVGHGWSVGVRNPLRPAQRLGALRLQNRALATSGSGTQFFVHEGRRYGHILDPRSGWPAEGVLSATVVAPTAAEADALSTAFYVLGPAGARDYCERHPEISAVMLCPGEREGTVERHFLGIDPHDWSELDEK